jgi:hypothetical protein
MEAVKHDHNAVLAAMLVDAVHDADVLEERQMRLEMPATRRHVGKAGPLDQHAGAGVDVWLHTGHYPPADTSTAPAPPQVQQRGGHSDREPGREGYRRLKR